ncbi:Protein tyrosine phosphatase type IVA 1 [Perkinsus chesapeaki]|uniref:Protein tyrosine phosphatase type IVA 1 n=1 Tax=Perkinsus chesapeaki TaxID=330153 RepID=A0A7J6MIB5_PERCH|nr:Protein tyrosine phosphatase type IVA 1 [Perkinsus chesapeaki]
MVARRRASVRISPLEVYVGEGEDEQDGGERVESDEDDIDSPRQLPVKRVKQRKISPQLLSLLQGAVGGNMRVDDVPIRPVSTSWSSSRYASTGSFGGDGAFGGMASAATMDLSFMNPSGGGIRALIASVARKHSFDAIMWIVVLMSTLLAGLETDVVGRPSSEKRTEILVFQLLQMLCLAGFTVELFIHAKKLGWGILFDSWTLVDFMLLVFGVYDVYFGLKSIDLDPNDPSAGSDDKLQLGSAMRIIRLVRPVSLVRHSSGLKQLWVLVAGIEATLRTLVWITIILGIIMLVVASYFTLIVGQSTSHLPSPSEVALALGTSQLDNVHVWPELSQYFGNIGRSLLTCLQLLTLDNWYTVSREVLEINLAANILIIFVVYSCSYGMLKALLGVVVERVMAVSDGNEVERAKLIYQLEVQFIRSLQGEFEKADVDGSGTLRWDEFQKSVLGDPSMKQKLALIDIQPAMVEELFKILDVDGSGSITCEEFVSGLLRLRGDAKARDMLTLRVTLLGLLEKLEDIEERMRLMNLTLTGTGSDVNRWRDLFEENRLRCQAVQESIENNARVKTLKRKVIASVHTEIDKSRNDVVRAATAAGGDRRRRSYPENERQGEKMGWMLSPELEARAKTAAEAGMRRLDDGAGSPTVLVEEEGSEQSTLSGGNVMAAVAVKPLHSSRVERRLREHTKRAELYRRYKAGLMVDDWARPPAGTYNYLVSPKGPTLVTGGDSGRFKMVICEAPTHENARAVALYLKNRFGVTDLIRVSSDNDSRYPRGAFEELEIALHDLPFADGCSPPEWVIEDFMEILDSSLYKKKCATAKPPCVAIHCISGLGRSPVMVALGLIERENMEPTDALRLVRQLRSSRCFTKEQSAFLHGYTPMTSAIAVFIVPRDHRDGYHQMRH